MKIFNRSGLITLLGLSLTFILFQNFSNSDIIVRNSRAQIDMPYGAIGAYIWNGYASSAPKDLTREVPVESRYTLQKHVEITTRSGFAGVRLKVGRDSFDYYNFGLSQTQAKKAVTELADFVTSPEMEVFRSTFRTQGLQVAMLTTTDFGFKGQDKDKDNYKYNPAILAEVQDKKEKIYNEYYRFGRALMHEFKDQNLTFIITNWEGDNFLYPSASSECDGLAKALEKTGTCEQSYVTSRMEGFREWLKIRGQALRAAYADAKASNSNLKAKLFYAIEINGYRSIRDAEEKNKQKYVNVLDDIASELNPDFISYSSWSSLKTTSQAFKQDILRLRRDIQSKGLKSKVIIGEFGFDYKVACRSPKEAADLLREYASVIQNPAVGVYAGFIWQAFSEENKAITSDNSCDNPSAKIDDLKPFRYGLYKRDGTPYVSLSYLLNSDTGKQIPQSIFYPSPRGNPIFKENSLNMMGLFPRVTKDGLKLQIRCDNPASLNEFVSLETGETWVIFPLPDSSLRSSNCKYRVQSSFSTASPWLRFP